MTPSLKIGRRGPLAYHGRGPVHMFCLENRTFITSSISSVKSRSRSITSTFSGDLAR